MSNWGLQKALFAALNEIGDWKAYDAVPQGAAFPYVVMDGQLANDAQLLSHPREDVRLYLSVWSRVKGQEEVLRIMRAIKDALHNRRLPLEDGYLVSLTVSRMLTQKDIGDETYIGYVTLNLRLSPGRLPMPTINRASPWLTNKAKPEIPGAARPGFRVTIYLDGARAGETVADENGEWLFTFAPLASGTYVVTARQSDAAGNKSPLSLPLTMIVDTLAPDAPIILTASPFVTTNTMPVIGGTAEAGATITIYLDDEWDGETEADDDGAWSFAVPGLFAGNSYEVFATATDAAGNTSAPSAPLTLVVNHPLAIEGEPVTLGIMGEAYAGFTASVPPQHGVPPFAFSLLNAAPGLSIDADTGEVSGTLTQAGIFEAITVQVEDSE